MSASLFSVYISLFDLLFYRIACQYVLFLRFM